MAELDNNLTKFLQKITDDTTNTMKRLLASSGKMDTRIYSKVKLILKPSDKGYNISNILPPYTVYVDKGRRPGKRPPLEAIRIWMFRNNITFRSKKGRVLSTHETAFLIARKIGREGIPPTNFLYPFRSLEKGLAPALTKEFKELILKVIVEIKNNKRK